MTNKTDIMCYAEGRSFQTSENSTFRVTIQKHAATRGVLKKSSLKSFAVFTGTNLCLNLLFN